MKILFLSSLFNFGKKKIEILRIHFFILFPFFLLPLLLRWRPCVQQRKQASCDPRIFPSPGRRSRDNIKEAMKIEFAKEFQFLILIFRILRKTNWHSGTRIHPAKGIQATFYNTLIFKHHLGCWYNSEIMSPT